MRHPVDMVETILGEIARLGPGRRLIALAGPPAAGKSTLAADLVARLPAAALVPMDGFHLDNRLLHAAGLRAVKGAPETFDAAGFVAMVTRLRSGAEVVHPLFDRDHDMAIAGAGRVAADTGIVVVEGNYLLLDQPPWDGLARLWDLSVLIAPPIATLQRRLTARWQGLNRSPDQIVAHLRNDLANARLVLERSRTPHLQFTDPGPSDETP